jgi:hypothetical protein
MTFFGITYKKYGFYLNIFDIPLISMDHSLILLVHLQDGKFTPVQ